jgi:hypothetical protein
MTLKKDEIQKIEEQLKHTDADQTIIENLSMPLFQNRIVRYANLMRNVMKIFMDAGFEYDAALKLTNTVLEYILHSASADMPAVVKPKTEDANYVR